MSTHIQIQGIIPRIQYVADGSLTTYSFPFAIFQTSDIKVYLNDILQTADTYTVTIDTQSHAGSVVFLIAPQNGTKITIMRELAIERTSDFQEGSALRADVLNDELDYQIACQQQIAENLNRAMVLPPYAVDNNLDLTLPLPSAGKAIVWNADGTNLENSTVSINALESTLNGYKTAAETAASTATTKAGIASDKADIATEKAGIATDKAAEAVSTLANKAEKDFSNVSETNARQLIGNRIWISDDYDLSNAANVVITHNLNLTDITKALAIPYIKFTTDLEGYSVGDIISNAQIITVYYKPNGSWASAHGFGNFLNLYQNTVILPKIRDNTSSVFIFNKNTGDRVAIAASNVKVFVKIIY